MSPTGPISTLKDAYNLLSACVGLVGFVTDYGVAYSIATGMSLM